MKIDHTEFKLDNGAAIIDMKRASVGYIVLAKTASKYDPFVTWWANDERTKGVLDCVSGHYYQDLSDAVEDFVERS